MKEGDGGCGTFSWHACTHMEEGVGKCAARLPGTPGEQPFLAPELTGCCRKIRKIKYERTAERLLADYAKTVASAL